jgi:hypothetical protein
VYFSSLRALARARIRDPLAPLRLRKRVAFVAGCDVKSQLNRSVRLALEQKQPAGLVFLLETPIEHAKPE